MRVILKSKQNGTITFQVMENETYFTGLFGGPVICLLSFLERSRETRRSFGAAGAV